MTLVLFNRYFYKILYCCRYTYHEYIFFRGFLFKDFIVSKLVNAAKNRFTYRDHSQTNQAISLAVRMST